MAAASKPNTNPSGASDEQLKKNEMVGKVRGQDVDSSFHVYEFTDPETGEPLETEQTIHSDEGFVTAEKSAKPAAAPKEPAK